MRRSDKAILKKADIEKVIRSVNVCRVGFVDGRKPYVLPFNFGYHKGIFYLHCAAEGRKLEILKRNKNVSVEMDTDGEIVKAADACGYGYRYRSVIAEGTASVITGAGEKIRALDIIMKHVTGRAFGKYSVSKVAAIRIIRIKAKTMTGKRSGYTGNN
jgi:nitroimidazol reductase NimA-like FMN-containing flavoprotein (pyridoxamine 5'-phosphate oxidase superfamily)